MWEMGEGRQMCTHKHPLTQSTPNTQEKRRFRKRKGGKWSNKHTLIFFSYLHGQRREGVNKNVFKGG